MVSTEISGKLVADLKMLVADTQELLQATAEQSGEKVNAAREKARAALAQAQARVTAAETAITNRVQEATRTTDDYAHDRPWVVAGVVGLIALAVGFIAGRR